MPKKCEKRTLKSRACVPLRYVQSTIHYIFISLSDIIAYLIISFWPLSTRCCFWICKALLKTGCACTFLFWIYYFSSYWSTAFLDFQRTFFCYLTLFKIIFCKSEKYSILTSKMREIIALLCCVQKSSAKNKIF